MRLSQRLRRRILSLILCLLLAVPVRADCIHEFVEMRQEPTCDEGGMVWLECTGCGMTKGFQVLDPLDRKSVV